MLRSSSPSAKFVTHCHTNGNGSEVAGIYVVRAMTVSRVARMPEEELEFIMPLSPSKTLKTRFYSRLRSRVLHPLKSTMDALSGVF